MQNSHLWLQWLQAKDIQQMRLGLDRMRQICMVLKLAKPARYVITVAGTNGKGTTVQALQRLYTAAGYRVGAVISPHLLRVNERIQLAGAAVSDEGLFAAFAAIQPQVDQLGLTYYETMIVAALYIFKQQALDMVVLEVGLGGEYDAVNIIDNDLAIITNVDYDHEHVLGPTLDDIGTAKAGILRAHGLVVLGAAMPRSVYAKIKALQVTAYQLGQDFTWNYSDNRQQLQIDLLYARQQLTLAVPQLIPDNIVCALAAAVLLQPQLPGDYARLAQSLSTLQVAGRWQQYLVGQQQIVLDVGHNPHAMRFMVQKIQQVWRQRKVLLVFSMLQDKNIAECLTILNNVVAHWFMATIAKPRGVTAASLVQTLATVADPSPATAYSSVGDALAAAMAVAGAQQPILVCGSFRTVEAALLYLQAQA